MQKKNQQSNSIFDAIAPVYSIFFHYQVKAFRTILGRAREHLLVPQGSRVLDIGCGTGALAFCLSDMGYKVTAVDASKKMIEVAKKNNQANNVDFVVADALNGLPYKDKIFDLVIASYVAHGLEREPRRTFLKEAGRLAQKQVIIHDFNKRRKLLSDIVEWAEGGNYFYFINNAEDEMKALFPRVEVVSFAAQTAWYICTP
jgi:ubiquinone/menaquinone biosynthesis C-methylase UbiE